MALVCSIIAAIFTQSAPLSAVQMLWINLIMDSFAALALATEPPKESILERPPYDSDEYIINKDMAVTILATVIYQSIWLLVVLFAGPYMFNVQPGWDASPTDFSKSALMHYTIFFNLFVFLQIFNEINCRKLF